MKILCIGDPHLKITKFDLSLRFLRWVEEVIAQSQPDLVVNLGDSFHTHSVLRSEILSEFKHHVHRTLSSFGGEYIYLIGNHDMYKPDDAKYHALEPFKQITERFVVVDSITQQHDITFVPYQHDLSNFPTETLPICIAHQTFIGADYGYTRPDSGVDADKISADVIISGHVHLKQEFGKVIYPGSPFAQSVDDINQVKGLLLFDSESYTKEFIQCPLPMWRGYKYEISPTNSISQVHNDITTALNPNDHFVVEISGPKAEILAYQNSKEYKKLISSYSLRVKPVFTDKEKKLVKLSGLSMENIISEYYQKVYTGSIDKNTLTRKSLEILSKVRQDKSTSKRELLS